VRAHRDEVRARSDFGEDRVVGVPGSADAGGDDTAVAQLLFGLREARLRLPVIVCGGDDADRKLEERSDLRREDQRLPRLCRTVPRKERRSEFPIFRGGDEERRRHPARESIGVPADEIAAMRSVRSARSDGREVRLFRLLFQNLRDVSLAEHRLERDPGLLRSRFERGEDRTSGGQERVA
jgi:hypothetical protein